MAEADASCGEALAGLVLAAGAGRRFGGPKQLETVAGETLVARAVRTAAPFCEQGVLVVTGCAQARVVAALAGAPARAVYNPAWREGLGASLRQGIGAVPPAAGAVLVLLADQPAVGTAELATLCAAWRAAPAQPAAAVYAGGPGVPAIFPRSWWPRLAALHGDAGARALLRNADALSSVPMPAAAVDLDTPAALQRYRDGLD